MDTKIFWDVFRDTGDPLCWLLTRIPPTGEKKERTDERQSARVASVVR